VLDVVADIYTQKTKIKRLYLVGNCGRKARLLVKKQMGNDWADCELKRPINPMRRAGPKDFYKYWLIIAVATSGLDFTG